jgi:carboxyl-terminal processing protease
MRNSRLIAIGIAGVGLATTTLVATTGLSVRSYLEPSVPSNLELIVGVIKIVERDYVHAVGQELLIKYALKGMLSRLDPHSDYMDEQEYRQARADIRGRFGGIGIEILIQDGRPKVIAAIDGTPAALAGIEFGDLIISIGGQSTQGMDPAQIIDAIRGNAGSAVTVTLSRGNKAPFDVTLNRTIIHAQSVKSMLEPNGFGYARIISFIDDTPEDLKQTIEHLKLQTGGNLKGFVLDLRNNPGGLLTSAVDVAGEFLNGGTVVTIHGRHANDDQAFKSDAKGDLLPGTPVVILIDGASASASEIVAGALQDQHRATLMGTQSFGKGSVQTIMPLNGHGALRLTTALYYTPSGRSIQGEGISPDIVVEALKEEQIASAVLLGERTLNGAIPNPGPLGQPNATKSRSPTEDKERYSAPMREDLIGTREDAQLNAALSYLNRSTGVD